MRTSELARETGVTRRALRLYEQRGLIAPPRSLDNGYRVYDRPTVERIHTIRLLQSIGFSLDRISQIIGPTEIDWVETLEVQERLLARRQAEIGGALAQVRRTLSEIRRGGVAGDEAVLALIAAADLNQDETDMQDDVMNFYNEKAREKLANHPATPEEVRAGEEAWAEIAREIQAMVAAGTSPASAEAQALLPRMDKLIGAFTMGDPDVTAGLNKMWSKPENVTRVMENLPEADKARAAVFTPEVFDFMGKIRAAAKK